MKQRYEIIIRRRNGRFLKIVPAKSKYDAKKKICKLEKKYESTTFYFEITPK